MRPVLVADVDVGVGDEVEAVLPSEQLIMLETKLGQD